jgi:muramoyltetrapeptide carboxypeptidase
LRVLESRYRVVYDESLLARTGYLAGDDDRRADELNGYLRSPDVRAIVCARGGYGLLRILHRLDGDALRRDPKLVVGFSDATALLSFCVLDASVRPLHGPMVTQLANLSAQDAEWLFRMMESPAAAGALPGPLLRIGDRGGGTVDGRIVGGNLELLTRLVGTPWEMDLGASVALLEEVGERPYRIDRALTQLHLAGALDGVRAVVVGDLTRCEEADGSPPSAAAVVSERLGAFELPGVAGLPVGHGERNLALPIGALAAVDLAEPRIILEEAAVA